MMAVLHTYSNPKTRKFLRPHYVDIVSILTAFTDLDVSGSSERTALWESSQKALEISMRSFVGVFLFAR
jgi:stage V sporulation protein SpoVS|tara:strand:+ start:374 stop:580 length:207 start_codon:yes stop_codon:yes gene_type:complete